MQAHTVQLTELPTPNDKLGQQIAQTIQTSADRSSLLSEIACAIGEAFGLDGCLIVVRDSRLVEDSSVSVLEHSCGSQLGLTFQMLDGHPSQLIGLVSSRATLKDETRAIVTLLEENDFVAIDDLGVNGCNVALRHFWETLEAQAVLAIKTEMQGFVNGGIALMRHTPYCWTDSDKELLKTVSDQVAVAISQVVDKRAIGTLQQQVGAFTEHRNLIERLTMAIHNALDLNQILQLAIDGIAETFRVNQGLVLLLKYIDPLFATRMACGDGKLTTPQAKRLPKAKVTVASVSPVVQLNSQGESLLNQSFWVSDCALCSMAFTDGPLPLVIADKRELLSSYSGVEVASIFSPQVFPALLLVPLMGMSTGSSGGGTVLGFLALQHDSPRFWAPEELELVELIAAQLSTAIIQTQTMQHVQALVEERTAQLQRSLEVQAKLYEKTRQQIDQLRRLNQLKDEFLATMSHELRTPLTSMRMAIQMLRQPGLPEDRRGKYLDILEQQCLQETSLINDLLTLQKLESNSEKLQLQKVNLIDLIAELSESFERNWGSKKLKLSVNLPKRSVKLETDRDSLYRILEELLTNAGKYSDPGTTVVLRAKSCVCDGNAVVVLSLSNTGRGISASELPYIFDKFRRGQGVTQQAIAGTGLGLALVKSLVQHLNGSINVSSEPSAEGVAWETCFTLTLPQVFDCSKV
ncbi:ATP-binding protein [Ancylothrix sp. C2]|uniref:sensor histidine kinase n=1 Tax=Ancylothrix sp. D3o TaxID=2953691 RepID=UPI0021BAAA7D|nr:ATP-binding protein [Ancylothrix sp. D3o]MCT7949079.1 ATP-binding protein [Ancylothrix sp. D3o]